MYTKVNYSEIKIKFSEKEKNRERTKCSQHKRYYLQNLINKECSKNEGVQSGQKIKHEIQSHSS